MAAAREKRRKRGAMTRVASRVVALSFPKGTFA